MSGSSKGLESARKKCSKGIANSHSQSALNGFAMTPLQSSSIPSAARLLEQNKRENSDVATLTLKVFRGRVSFPYHLSIIEVDADLDERSAHHTLFCISLFLSVCNFWKETSITNLVSVTVTLTSFTLRPRGTPIHE